MTTSHVQGQQPEYAAHKQIQFGPTLLDGYMCDDGEFRMSMASAARSLGCHHSVIQRTIGSCLTLSQSQGVRTDALPQIASSNRSLTISGSEGTAGQNDCSATDLVLSQGQNGAPGERHREKPVVVPLKAMGIGQGAHTINIATVIAVWMRVAEEGGKYAMPALKLLGMSAAHSLELRFQEAFGVTDTRNTQDRLIDWAVNFDPGEHTPLFGGPFAKHFARVTGAAIGHPYARVCLAELVYDRLPKKVYDTLKGLNPMKENGWREYTYSQLMTEDMKEEVRKLLLVVTHELTNTESKSMNPKAYRECLKRLDISYPRHKRRGKQPKLSKKSGVQQIEL